MRSAREFIAAEIDPGTWESWDRPVAAAPATAVDYAATDYVATDYAATDYAATDYAATLADARERTGLDEAVLTGAGRLRGRPVAVVACEFRFLGGSIGVAAAERLTAAVERATARRLPLIALTASGGTRMQEGTVAFLQMVKITQAVAAHRAAGLPYLVYLRHPTTGGVFASWGSLGHVTVAEPGALIGFLGPRVYQALHGQPFPDGVQTAENLHRNGLVDAVLPPAEAADLADRALTVLCAPRSGLPRSGLPRSGLPRPAPLNAAVPTDATPDNATVEAGASGAGASGAGASGAGGPPAWESVRRSRRADRPGVRRLLRAAATDVVTLNGTQEGEASPGLLLALARFGAAPAVVLGQDRRGQTAEAPLDTGALRAARRGMRLAAELRLPLVTVVDTPGAALSRQAEESGLAGEIARCLADLVTLAAPTLCVLLGQGSGGAALALLPADRVVAAEHGWLSPLPPEGAAEILHRDPGRAPEAAARLGIRSRDLRAAGIVDRIVPERPDAADEPDAFLGRLGTVIADELAALLDADPARRRAARAARYRRLGA